MSVDTPELSAIERALETPPAPIKTAFERQPFRQWLDGQMVAMLTIAALAAVLLSAVFFPWFEYGLSAILPIALATAILVMVLLAIIYPVSQYRMKRWQAAREARRYSLEKQFVDTLSKACAGDEAACERVAEWPDANLSTDVYRTAAAEMATTVRDASAAKLREESLAELDAELVREQATINDQETSPLEQFWAQSRRYQVLGRFHNCLYHTPPKLWGYFKSSWPSVELVKTWCQSARLMAVNAGFDLLRRALEDGEGDLVELAKVRDEVRRLARMNELWGQQALPRDWNTVVARLFLDPNERLFNIKYGLTTPERLLFVGRVLQNLKAPEPSGLSGQYLTEVMLALAFAQHEDVREELSAEALTTLWTYAGGRNRRGGPPLGWITEV